MKNLGQMMKKAQEMQSKMADAQSRLDNIEVKGEAGAGLVKVTATAKGHVIRIDIDESILQPSEKEVIEDLIVAAVSDAQEKAKNKEKEEMTNITDGLGLPPGMKLPF